ncbi:MAG TPA: hypothetical protein V6D20_17325, partial [Candidatus Obscuribacterales bacterium]
MGDEHQLEEAAVVGEVVDHKLVLLARQTIALRNSNLQAGVAVGVVDIVAVAADWVAVAWETAVA